MQNNTNFLERLSLVYFFALGGLVFLVISPLVFSFSFLSNFFPRLKVVYYAVFYLGAKFYIAASPVKFRIKNLETLKEMGSERYLIVSNHRSHLDMFLFLANICTLRAVANAKLFKIPGLGLAMKVLGNFPMKRGDIDTYKKTIKRIIKAFHENHVVLFFPEMTRCLPGDPGMQKFRLTAFQLARENDIKIIPVVVQGTDKVWPKGHHGMNFKHNVSIVALDPVDPVRFYSSADLSMHIYEVMEKKLVELNS